MPRQLLEELEEQQELTEATTRRGVDTSSYQFDDVSVFNVPIYTANPSGTVFATIAHQNGSTTIYFGSGATNPLNFSTPAIRSRKAIIRRMRETGKYSRSFLEDYEQSLKDSDYFVE